MWGWHGHRHYRGGHWRGGMHFNWWTPFLFIGFFVVIGRAGWLLWLIIPAFFFFVIPMIKRGRSEWERQGGGWGGWDRAEMEKRKRDFSGDWSWSNRAEQDEKPKRNATYVVGDDGELSEMPYTPPRKRNDDDIEYV